MSGEYEVGYGKPPQHTRFQKGRSSNPRGRPKAARNLRTVLKEELGQLIVVREGGRERKVSKLEATVKSLLNQALKGNIRAVGEVFELNRRLLEDEPASQATVPVMPEDQAMLDDLARRLLAAFEAPLDDTDLPLEPTTGDPEPKP